MKMFALCVLALVALCGCQIEPGRVVVYEPEVYPENIPGWVPAAPAYGTPPPLVIHSRRLGWTPAPGHCRPARIVVIPPLRHRRGGYHGPRPGFYHHGRHRRRRR